MMSVRALDAKGDVEEEENYSCEPVHGGLEIDNKSRKGIAPLGFAVTDAPPGLGAVNTVQASS
jgi:hypothetical protein